MIGCMSSEDSRAMPIDDFAINASMRDSESQWNKYSKSIRQSREQAFNSRDTIASRQDLKPNSALTNFVPN